MRLRCLQCGERFERSHKGKFCSSSCGGVHAARAAQAKRDKQDALRFSRTYIIAMCAEIRSKWTPDDFIRRREYQD